MRIDYKECVYDPRMKTWTHRGKFIKERFSVLCDLYTVEDQIADTLQGNHDLKTDIEVMTRLSDLNLKKTNIEKRILEYKQNSRGRYVKLVARK